MSVFKRRGFSAHKEEQKRRDAVQEAKRGKLFDFYLKDDDEPDAPIRFLTEEPILWYRHRIKMGGHFVNVACTADKNGDGCDHCDGGDRSSYVGSWLVVDGREFESDEYKNGKKTGKRVMKKDRLKLFTRGSTDIAKLELKSKKFGLTTRPWFVNKTGSDQSTSYELERGEPDKLTSKQIAKLIEQLPENYRKLYDPSDEESLYAIVEAQVFGFEGEGGDDDGDEPEAPKKPAGKKPGLKKPASRPSRNDDEEEGGDDEDDVSEGVQSLDDEDEDDAPPPKKPGIKKPGAKPAIKPANKPKVGIKKPAAKPLGKRK